jgi:hypothetical protein
MTNAGITDNVMMADLETVSNAQISTSVKKYGTGSLAFNGSSSLSQPSSNQYIFQVGDLTIEAWIYFNTVTSGTWCTTNVSGGFYWQYYSSAVQFGLAGGGAFVSSSWTPSASTWYHVATVRSGNTITHYINGTSIGSGTLIGAIYATTTLQIGTGAAGGSFNGYIDDFRITKGIARYTTNFTPPAQAFGALTQVATASDSYFRQVTLLLSGDGTNAAQNNTFTDSSSNNFSITRNGNTTQGTFSPYGDKWSNYFNGSSTYLTVADNTAFQFGSGAFTVECWFFASSVASNQGLVTKWADGQPDSSAAWGLDITSGVIRGIVASSSTLTTLTGTAPATNTWNHAVLVRNSSNTLSLFLNGTRVATATYSSTINNGAYAVNIGSANGNNRVYTGYISNARVVKGTAVYDPTQTTLTVPAAPITAVTNTQLLTCQSNRFIDNSTNNWAITVAGTPTVQRFSPFSPTAAYSASVIGGSGYFDGTGDYLSAPDSEAWNFGSGNFTVEAWYYPTSSTAQQVIVAQWDGVGGGTGLSWVLMTSNDSARNLRALISSNGSGVVFDLISSSPLILNAWNHVAFVRSGTTFQLYINGAAATGGSTTSSATLYNATNPMTIGASSAGGQYCTGYIADARVVKGTALYTGSTYTVPTAPLTAISGTSLLTNFTNAGIFDNAMMTDLETVGNAQISTSVVKYGTGSMYLPNTSTSDYLVSPINGQLSGNFTLEMWLYPTSIVSGNAFLYSIGAEVSSRFAFYLKNGVPYLNIYTGAETALGSTALSATTWSHLAFVRYGSTITAYINGTNVGSTTSYTGTLGASSLVYIGSDSGVTSKYKGYIDDLRITQGYARYTSNFTPPDALPNTQ